MQTIRLGIIGDFNPGNPLHLATAKAMEHASAALGANATSEWLPTGGSHNYEVFDALLCSPGSPYQSLDGALTGIRYARENGIPFIGTCGGFQHAVLEYARNVIGIREAMHAEYDPQAPLLFVTPLSCSLVGKTMQIDLSSGSRAAMAYGATEAEESYYCNFGLNPACHDSLQEAGLLISGWDKDREARIVELPSHPFFIGTLFVPQAKSRPEQPHPLVVSLCRAAIDRRVRM